MRNQSWKSILSLCAVMVLVAFPFGCNSTDEDEGEGAMDNTATGTGTDTGMTDTGSTMGTDPNAGMGGTGMTDDTTLQTNVQTAITNDPALSGQSITATVSAGTVTLTGTVTTQEQKTAAETAARGISGVTNVDNQITVSAQ